MVNLPELIENVQRSASSARCDMTTILHQCKHVATQLQNEDFVAWAKSEIEGYSAEAVVPEYRMVFITLKGVFFNPNVQPTTLDIPTDKIPDALRKYLSPYKVKEGIADIQMWTQAPQGHGLVMPLNDLAPFFKNAFQFVEFGGHTKQGMECHELYGALNMGDAAKILDVVRGKVLDFSYGAMAKAAPNDSEKQDHDSQQMVQQFFGGQNTFVSGHHNVVSVSGVAKGDYNSLYALTQRGLTHEDIVALQTALKTELETMGGKFGPKAQQWIDKMIEKAKDGIWDISVKEGRELLRVALERFYG